MKVFFYGFESIMTPNWTVKEFEKLKFWMRV